MKNLVAKALAAYWTNKEGLVTIEWVGIAAVIVVAGILITATIMEGADGLGGQVDTTLSAVNPTGNVPNTTFTNLGNGVNN